METYFEAAIKNVYKYGDTDIFPFPIENRILHDRKDHIVSILEKYYKNFDQYFSETPPTDIRSMVAAQHTGFRWATQLDPMWNAYFLGIVLSIAELIENARVTPDIVFSYRVNSSTIADGKIFRDDISWHSFMQSTAEALADYKYILICDIADCYSRISHHKLENSLKAITNDGIKIRSVLKYLSLLTETRSSGLPIGGPASRLLAELALNNVDCFIRDHGIKFLRFADDFHILANSRKEAFEYLFLLSESLDNEGLGLQKSKTRLITKSEYETISESIFGRKNEKTPIQQLMSMTLRYDPYSPDAEIKYDELKKKLKEIDVIGLLNEQLSRTQIHMATSRKIVSALKALDAKDQFGATMSMLENMDNLWQLSG